MKKSLLAIVFISGLQGLHAQDVHFSQILNNPLQVNPASAGGYDGYERLVLNYRSQWVNLGAPYRTMGASFDMPVFQKDAEKAHLGVGFNFFSDKAGDSRMGLSQGNLTVTAILPMKRHHYFSTGIQIGFAQRKADLTNMMWENQYDGSGWNGALPSYENALAPTFGYFDAAAGIRYQFRNSKGFDVLNFYSAEFGLSAYHVTRPRLHYMGNDEKLDMRYVAHGSSRIDMPNAYMGFVPFFCIYMQGPMSEYNFGLLARFRVSKGTKITGLNTESNLFVGAMYRMNDAVIPTVMFEFGPFGLGVSYDYNISTLNQVSNGQGGLEVALKFHDTKGVVFNHRSGSRIY